MAENDIHTIGLSILGLAVTVLMAMFGFLWTAISRLSADVKQDIARMDDEQREGLAHTADAIEAKAGEHRQGQQQLWSELRLAEVRANEYRQRVEERLGQLPTRDEMQAARIETRGDLRAMEDRLLAVIRTEVHRV